MAEAETPLYRATAQVYLDHLYEPGQEIAGYLGIPNRAMEPLNAAAEDAVAARDLRRAVVRNPEQAAVVAVVSEADTLRDEILKADSLNGSLVADLARVTGERDAALASLGAANVAASDLRAKVDEAETATLTALENLDKANAEIADLKAQVAKFDHDGNGKAGGSNKRGATKASA